MDKQTIINDLNNLKGLFAHITDHAHEAANGGTEWKPKKRTMGPLGIKGLKYRLRYIRDKAKLGQESCDFIKAEIEQLVEVKEHCEMLKGVLRCCLADLEGIMPEFEPDGERSHPGWQSIDEAKVVLAETE